RHCASLPGNRPARGGMRTPADKRVGWSAGRVIRTCVAVRLLLSGCKPTYTGLARRLGSDIIVTASSCRLSIPDQPEPFVFGSRVPLKTLAVLCKSLSTMLHSGVALVKALEIASRKTGDPGCRKQLVAVREEVQRGCDIAQALREQGKYFPELMIDMV